MSAQQVGDILTHLSAFFLGVSVATFTIYRKLHRSRRCQDCCPTKEE